MSDQPTPTEHAKWVYEQVRDEARRAHDRFAEFHLALSESAIKNSELTLRTGVLINGGAAISVLAFIGGPTTKWWNLSRRVMYDLAIFAGLASLILFVMCMFDVKDAITTFSNDRGLNIPIKNTSHPAIEC